MMSFNMTPEERFWIITTIGAVIAWFGKDFIPGIFGGWKKKKRTCEQENGQLRASLSQFAAAFEVLLVAIELPANSNIRSEKIVRARELAEQASVILGVGHPLQGETE